MTVNPAVYEAIVEVVRARYEAIALDVMNGLTGVCCSGDSSGDKATDPITRDIYPAYELMQVPDRAMQAALGCGHPTAMAGLQPGETVLDLGCGGGIDVFFATRHIGKTGFAYGVDMIDTMVKLAQSIADEAEVKNVAFINGDMAALPLADACVDVIISNFAINLLPDKEPLFREAFRVLKPGGRFAVADVIIHGGLPASVPDDIETRRDLSSWAGCLAGASTDAEYRDGLIGAGFNGVEMKVTRRFSLSDLPSSQQSLLSWMGEDVAAQIISRFASTFVRAAKPAS